MKFPRIEIENSTNTHGGTLIDGCLSSFVVVASIESMRRTLNMIASSGNETSILFLLVVLNVTILNLFLPTIESKYKA